MKPGSFQKLEDISSVESNITTSLRCVHYIYLTYRAGILVFIFFIQIFFHIKTRTYRAYILRLFGNFRFLSNLRASPTGKFSIESNKFAGKLRVSMKTSYLSCLRIRAQNCIFWLFDCTVYTITYS